eukprot:scaffold620801_cov19-Prasinocladus_malaysianus.AAC.1
MPFLDGCNPWIGCMHYGTACIDIPSSISAAAYRRIIIVVWCMMYMDKTGITLSKCIFYIMVGAMD